MTSATLTRIHVPTADEFEPGEDYLPAADLSACLESLIADYPRSIGHLEDLSVIVLWKQKGGKSKGKAKLGQCQKPSGLLAHFCTADFVIWLAADHSVDQNLTDAQLRAAVYHEALHIGWEEGEDGEDGHAVLVGHDVETFVAEIRDMGAWHEMLTATASAFSQAGLFG